ncbi:hypothetical protein Anas_14747, partial [Armadillidium nasatum]
MKSFSCSSRMKRFVSKKAESCVKETYFTSVYSNCSKGRVAKTIPDKRPSLYVESFHVGCLFKRQPILGLYWKLNFSYCRSFTHPRRIFKIHHSLKYLSVCQSLLCRDSTTYFWRSHRDYFLPKDFIMSDVDKVEERRGCEQDEELLGSWKTKINKFFKDIQDIENSNLKETVTKILTGKMMESSTEAFGKFSVSAPRNANAERKSNIDSKKYHLNEHCSDSYMGSTESNDSDESIRRTFKKEKTKKK